MRVARSSLLSQFAGSAQESAMRPWCNLVDQALYLAWFTAATFQRGRLRPPARSRRSPIAALRSARSGCSWRQCGVACLAGAERAHSGPWSRPATFQTAIARCRTGLRSSRSFPSCGRCPRLPRPRASARRLPRCLAGTREAFCPPPALPSCRGHKRRRRS